MKQALVQAWYTDAAWTRLLLPLAWLYRILVAIRRALYRHGVLPGRRLPVPVIVVGNISVGGTGKTPLVAWFVQRLCERGRRPGIVSRGYGGHARHWPQVVNADSDPQQVGDEPVLLARLTGCPVAVSPRRVQAGDLLVEQGVDVIVADDGLQHYALYRDAEIAVRDDVRGYGNRLLLPAGPLREPLSRLQSVDLELVNGEAGDFLLEPGQARPVSVTGEPRELTDFADAPVHALAGIGYPERFFASLRRAGLQVTGHAFADHHAFRPDDIYFDDDSPVLMTEKDAVKCQGFADERHWLVPVSARPTVKAERRIEALFDRVLGEAA